MVKVASNVEKIKIEKKVKVKKKSGPFASFPL